ncbi:MAG: amidohydrolase family protein [Spirochaetia bacterium]
MKTFTLSGQAKDYFETHLSDFVPSRVWDSHVHVFYPGTGSTGAGVGPEDACTSGVVSAWDSKLLPGRKMGYSIVGHPFPGMDTQKMADFTLEQTRSFSRSADLTIRFPAGAFPNVSPAMPVDEVEELARDPFTAGLKPYRFFSVTGDIDECGITDFLPEEQIAAANRHGLIILLHLSKKRGPADPGNLRDLEKLTAKYPRVKWQLAHCARSFNPLFLEEAVSELKQLPNIWYDTSAVCESAVFDILFSEIDHSRILYGSDHSPVHVAGGKYVSFGRGWMWISPDNSEKKITHCDAAPFPMVYEELYAMKKAANHAGYGKQELDQIFYKNSRDLISEILSNKAKI